MSAGGDEPSAKSDGGFLSSPKELKADAKIRTRIINGLYALDTAAVRDCLAGIAGNTAEPYVVRLLALTSLAKCPQCDWAVVETFKQDKSLRDMASSLLAEHNKNTPTK